MGIVGVGTFLPETVMTSSDVAAASGLPEWVVRDKLGITQKHVSDHSIHPNEMAALAAEDCFLRTGTDPKTIDVLLCTTEEWREYGLWTAGIDLAYQIGATEAWGLDLHMRCATTISALKLARSLMSEDPDIDTVMIAGGYGISDFIDLTNDRTSFMFNIGAGAGAMIVKRDWPANQVLGTHLISDGSLSRSVLVPASGTIQHPTDAAVRDGKFKFDVLEPEFMKSRLEEVSIPNWMECVDRALEKSGTKPDGSPYGRSDVDYLDMLLVKPSAHRQILDEMGLDDDQSVYLGDVGHIGEQDSIISIARGLEEGKLNDGDLMVIVGAGIGYVWGASVVRWGPQDG